MELFKLPDTARVQKVIPKNAFDSYLTPKQKKLFANIVYRITWIHKLSQDTINLEAKEIKEIQLFKIELKTKTDANHLLDLIDKAVPYNIIFIVVYNDEVYLSTTSKHPHPMNQDNAVIDWTFKTDWFMSSDNSYQINLKGNLDSVYLDFCMQLSPNSVNKGSTVNDLISLDKSQSILLKEIEHLKAKIKACKQFNIKVELNLLLKDKEKKLIKSQ